MAGRVSERVTQAQQAGMFPAAKPGNVFSVAPKLWLITSPRLWSMTYFSAFIISGKPVTPSVSAVGVSTSRIFAPGAMACAYSTSSVVSSAQPSMVALDGLNLGSLPNASTSSAGGSGRPHCLIEDRQVMADGRRAERIDDDDRPPLAGDAGAVQRIEVVGHAVLQRAVAAELEGGEALGRAERVRGLQLDHRRPGDRRNGSRPSPAPERRRARDRAGTGQGGGGRAGPGADCAGGAEGWRRQAGGGQAGGGDPGGGEGQRRGEGGQPQEPPAPGDPRSAAPRSPAGARQHDAPHWHGTPSARRATAHLSHPSADSRITQCSRGVSWRKLCLAIPEYVQIYSVVSVSPSSARMSSKDKPEASGPPAPATPAGRPTAERRPPHDIRPATTCTQTVIQPCRCSDVGRQAIRKPGRRLATISQVRRAASSIGRAADS